MIDQVTLLTYLAVLLGFVLIPGPAVLLTVARASASGIRAGLATGLGIALGDIAHTAFAVIGLSAVIQTSALAFAMVKYAGAAYLVWLGIRAILDHRPLSIGTGGPPLSAGRAFRQATLAEILNPKSALFFLAFLPQFVRPENGPVALQLTILGLLFVAMGLLSTVLFAFAAGQVGGFLRRNPVVARWQGRVTGAIFCGLGVRLALQER
ncbi:LysE family translocator [Marinibaculum pumilum]|uniref:LysE family translocator n=1 Tax=Marinibaculum pumilum TaxID=1766165 RepID=A0ABV7KVM3_9PROT